MANSNEEFAKIVYEGNLHLSVNGGYEITADSLNYILRRKSGKKFFIEGYYRSLSDLMDDLLELKLKESEAKTINAMKKELTKAHADIKELCNEINDNVKNN